MAARVAQYITVIDRSDKVIKNSRQFKDVFQEAKGAYKARKTEIKAKRQAKEDVELEKAIRSVNLERETERSTTVRPDASRRHSSQRNSPPRRRSPSEQDRPRAQRMHSNASARDSGYTTPQDDRPRQMSLGEFNDAIYGPNGAATQYGRASQTAPTSPRAAGWNDQDPDARTLVRARTDLPLDVHRRPSPLARSHSMDDVDLDLAYGEYHPESLAITPNERNEKELNTLVLKCKMLLDEADCVGHSAKAIISNLQKNPDTLAQVGLTLAEISNIASKMAPGALGMIAKSAPAVMALLISPQFLIAVGVSVGVTVIAIGGYKIVKKIKEKAGNDDDKDLDPGMDEAVDVHELDRIEAWRRGLPESTMVDDNGSVISSATSVEGEFITPFAAQSMGHLPAKSQTSRSKTFKKSKDKDKDKESKKEDKKRRKRRSTGDTESVDSRDTSTSSRRSSTTKNKDKALVKVKKPSPLSRLVDLASSVKS